VNLPGSGDDPGPAPPREPALENAASAAANPASSTSTTRPWRATARHWIFGWIATRRLAMLQPAH